MEAGNALCEGCRTNVAELFCTCNDMETFLCPECFQKHSKLRSPKGHHTWPVSDLSTYKDSGCFDRQEAFPKVRKLAMKAVEEVDRAITEYSRMMEKVIWEITLHVKATNRQLKDLKEHLSEEVSDGLDEVLRTLMEPQPQLRSKYGPAFRALVEKLEPFQLFVFTVPSYPVSVKSLLTLQSSLRLPEELLAEIKPKPKPAPLQPSPPPQTYFDAEKETSAVAEAHYFESIQICAANFPNSQEFAMCYRNLGDLYKQLRRFEQAEMQYQQAISLYQARFSDSIEFARCLDLLGSLYREVKRYAESETSFLRALPIYSAHFPETIDYAICMHTLGLLYREMQRWEQAEIQLIQAISLYQTRFPHTIDFAKCLAALGSLYRAMKRYEESESHFLRALPIYSTHFPHDLGYAICLTNVGSLYYEIGQYEQANTTLLQACQVYQTHFPESSHYAGNLRNLGLLYEKTGKNREAGERLRAALRLFEKNEDQVMAGKCRIDLENLAQ